MNSCAELLQTKNATRFWVAFVVFEGLFAQIRGVLIAFGSGNAERSAPLPVLGHADADLLAGAISAVNSEFSTIHGHLHNRTIGGHYDLLVIDEYSTVSNANLLKTLRTSTFDLLVLVGDVHQIEAIEFGNQFTSIRPYLPTTSVFELTAPWRTKNPELLTLWDRVRNLDDCIEESLSTRRYSAVLGDALFESRQEDEIVLCVNYDGVYGINNVNRFLQTSNPSPAVVRRGATFKVGDPVLFNDTDRFRGVIYNNLKGTLVAITPAQGKVTFDVELAREIDSLDV